MQMCAATARRFSDAPSTGPLHARRATSQWSTLERPEHWLPVGDAALARDPLSSAGLTAALDGGDRCAAALDAALAGDPWAAEAYLEALVAERFVYLRRRSEVYGWEGRFSGASFWRRRRAADGAATHLSDHPPE